MCLHDIVNDLLLRYLLRSGNKRRKKFKKHAFSKCTLFHKFLWMEKYFTREEIVIIIEHLVGDMNGGTDLTCIHLYSFLMSSSKDYIDNFCELLILDITERQYSRYCHLCVLKHKTLFFRRQYLLKHSKNNILIVGCMNCKDFLHRIQSEKSKISMA